MSTGRQVDAENERNARLEEKVTLTRRELRANAAANWDAGYLACKEGQQQHNPYRETRQAAGVQCRRQENPPSGFRCANPWHDKGALRATFEGRTVLGERLKPDP